MSDILQQMCVTALNGEQIMFFDMRHKAEIDGRREEYEIARLDNLSKLGVSGYEIGPITVTGVSVSLDKRN